MTLVLDASVALDFCLASENSAYARDVLAHAYDSGALVPPVWPTEVANGLLVAQRRGRLTLNDAEHVLALLSDIEVSVAQEPAIAHMRSALAIGERLGLTSYDASYLSLAMRQGLPLATNDRALRQAAITAGVPLFGTAPAAIV